MHCTLFKITYTVKYIGMVFKMFSDWRSIAAVQANARCIQLSSDAVVSITNVRVVC